MKLKGTYRQWFLWLAWIATVYHFLMPFTPVVDSVYFSSPVHHEMNVGDMHHNGMMMHMMPMDAGDGDTHSMGAKCPNCILGIHFYVQEQFFVPQPLVTLNTLLIAVLVFKEVIFSPWNWISPTSRDPPAYLSV